MLQNDIVWILPAQNNIEPMKKYRSYHIIWLLLSLFMQATAWIFARKASLVSRGSDAWAIVLNEWYALELVALVCQAFCWSMALRYFPLHVAYPLTSSVVGLNLLSAWLVFGEQISTNNIWGIGMITAGIILVIICCWKFLHEKVDRMTIAGCVLIVLGIFIFNLPAS